MEKFKSFFSGVVPVAVVCAIYIGWYMYKQHQVQQQRIQWEMRLKDTKPKGGVVVDRDGTIRWQD